MQLERLRRFQKCLRRASDASSLGEAQAAEAAARRLMEVYKIDPLVLTNKSLYDHTSFADNWLLLKLREERKLAKQHGRGAKKHKKVKPVKRGPFKLRNVKFKRKRKPSALKPSAPLALPSPLAQL